MPNQPRPDNPHRSVRVEDELWEAARIACAKLGTTRGDIMRQALRDAVDRADAPTWATRTTPPRPIDPCPQCGQPVTLIRAEAGRTWADDCGHRVMVTIWPDHVELSSDS